jgi:hypothetical protein
MLRHYFATRRFLISSAELKMMEMTAQRLGF